MGGVVCRSKSFTFRGRLPVDYQFTGRRQNITISVAKNSILKLFGTLQNVVLLKLRAPSYVLVTAFLV